MFKLRILGLGFLCGFIVFGQYNLEMARAEVSGPAVGNLSITVLPSPTPGQPEQLTIAFSGTGLLNITDWSVADLLGATTTRHIFDNQQLADGDSITLCSGNGTSSACDIYITGASIWNNTGDTVLIFDGDGMIQASLAFSEPLDDQEFNGSFPIDYAAESYTSELTLLTPTEDEIISGEYSFTALYVDKNGGPDEFIWWVRLGNCEDSGATVLGNVDGRTDDYGYGYNEGNLFVAIHDVSAWVPGEYCITIDPQEELWEADLSVTRWFLIGGLDNEEEEDEENPFEDEEKEDENEEENEEKNEGRSGGSFINNERPTPRVLGVTTNTPNTCGMYLTEYLGEGFSNTPLEVMKLQLFLTSRGLFTMTTGVYDANTEAGVRAYQSWYPTEILQPWVEAGIMPEAAPTGRVYKTTRAHINNSICPGSEAVEKLVLN